MSKLPKIDSSWTLFLDRDGVINERYFDRYVSTTDDFVFLPHAKEAISKLTKIFGRTVIVTNQQGIGKQLMTENDFQTVNNFMLSELAAAGAKIDKVYCCPHLKSENCDCRKPKSGMALQAKNNFPEIDFHKSIIAGDCDRDMQFGKNLSMFAVFIKSAESKETTGLADITFKSLQEFAESLD